MAAPTLISYTESASWATTAFSKSLASISWQVSDVLVCLAGSEDNTTLGVAGLPTNTGLGLSWANTESISGAGHCAALIATTVATSADSGIISLAETSGSLHWGFAVWVWRGSAGVGNHAQQVTTGKTKALTPTAANAGICWGFFDYSAAAGAGEPAGSPTPSNTREQTDDGGQYSIGVFDIIDQTSAGSVSYGATTTGTSGPYAIVIQEVKASASAGRTTKNTRGWNLGMEIGMDWNHGNI